MGGGGRRPRGAAGKSGHTHVQAQNISMCGLLSLEFYRPYFDVDTNQVKARLLQALWPIRMNSLFLYHADVEGSGGGGSAPDLYGPVWVSAQLRNRVFVKKKCRPVRRCCRLNSLRAI